MNEQILNIENTFENVAKVRSQLLTAKKIQLHTGLDGFDSPENFGIYKSTGGPALGVVGKVFEPMDLNFLLDGVVNSLVNCDNSNYNLDQLTYKEYKGGSKVSFEIPSNPIEIKCKLLGDVYQTKLIFSTGFDGLTKTSLSFSSLRLVCMNGAKSWKSDVQLSFKNTFGNIGKIALFCSEISKVSNDMKQYKKNLESISLVQLNTKQLDEYMTKVTGYNVADYKNLTTRKRNILDRINESIAIEQKNTGNTLYSALQGFTRYTTWNLSEGNQDNILFDLPEKLNKAAHIEAFTVVN